MHNHDLIWNIEVSEKPEFNLFKESEKPEFKYSSFNETTQLETTLFCNVSPFELKMIPMLSYVK